MESPKVKWVMRGNLGSLKRKRDQDPDSSTIDVSPSLVAGILEHIIYSKMPTTFYFTSFSISIILTVAPLGFFSPLILLPQ